MLKQTKTQTKDFQRKHKTHTKKNTSNKEEAFVGYKNMTGWCCSETITVLLMSWEQDGAKNKRPTW